MKTLAGPSQPTGRTLGASLILVTFHFHLERLFLLANRQEFRCRFRSGRQYYLHDSLRMLRRAGRMCLAGWLGGLDPVNDFNPLLQMPSGVYFTFLGSFVFGTPEFPVSDVPLQSIGRQLLNEL